MLRRLRIQLTLIYMLAGILLEVIMGAGLYWRLTSYFQTSTDLALKSRLTQELRQLRAPVTPALEEAEQDYQESLDSGFFNRSQITSTQTNSSTNTVIPSQLPTFPETETDTEESEGGGGEHTFQQGMDFSILASIPNQTEITDKVKLQILSTPTPSILINVESNPLLEGELALIFVIPLDSNGGVEPISSNQSFPISPQKEALRIRSRKWRRPAYDLFIRRHTDQAAHIPFTGRLPGSVLTTRPANR